jgi:hypothetical protein
MKLLGLVLILALALTGCNQTDTKKQQISDNTTYDVSNVSDKTNNGKAVGKEYGGKGAGYGQVKKIEGQAPPPLIEPPMGAEGQLEKFTEETLSRGVTKVEYVPDYWVGGDMILIHFEGYSPEYIMDWTEYFKVEAKAQELYGSKFNEMSYMVTDTENILQIYYYKE